MEPSFDASAPTTTAAHHQLHCDVQMDDDADGSQPCTSSSSPANQFLGDPRVFAAGQMVGDATAQSLLDFMSIGCEFLKLY